MLYKLLESPVLSLQIFLVVGAANLMAQINPDQIDIVRDQWGVPHIFAQTDAEVAYGFAWASCEDDFETLQMQLLPIRGLAGRVLGKKSVVFDIAFHLTDADQLVNNKYEADLSETFRNYLASYCAGINAYAKNHPKEILHRDLFPVKGPDIIKAFVLGLTLLSHADDDMIKLVEGKISRGDLPKGMGSNAFALSGKKTLDGKTYLAINSHQPLEGLNSWYEAHLCSEEGLNMLGATFVGSPVLSIGTNEYLGWCHTLNYADFSDVYQLEMHPEDPDLYRFDGKWEKLVPYHCKAKIKLFGFLGIGAKQKFWKSRYGVTFKNKQGCFAHRYLANQDIKAAEQWYEMCKSSSWTEFKSALELQGLPSMNLVYADREDRIYYLGNGRFPIRNDHYDWTKILPGNTSKTLWSTTWYPIDSLPQVTNPASGFVYSCNHTPYCSAGEGDNPDPEKIPPTTGFLPPEALTNRAVRLKGLLESRNRFSYDQFKAIKYDRSYHIPLISAPKLEPIFHLDPMIYPHIAPGIVALKNWDRVASEDSYEASIFILALYHIRGKARKLVHYRTGNVINEELLVEALTFAQDHLLQYFNKIQVPLGSLQRHRRGHIDLPVAGGPDVLAALSAGVQKDGRLKARSGDSFIELVRYSKEGVEIETVNAFGASANKNSPHYTDQMNLYVGNALKKMTLNKEEIYQQAKRIYHPK